MQPRLLVQQKISMFRNTYKVLNANSDGSAGAMLGVAKQKRFAFKEKLPFYTDEKNKRVAFTLQAQKVFDIHGRYFVLDDNGNTVGAFAKKFKQSLAASTWVILGPNGEELYTVTESNVTLAVLRRYASRIPYLGEVLGIVLLFFRYHFDVLTPTGVKVGFYEKKTLIRDHYLLSLTDEAWNTVDRRTWASMAVGLDALQSR